MIMKTKQNNVIKAVKSYSSNHLIRIITFNFDLAITCNALFQIFHCKTLKSYFIVARQGGFIVQYV